MPYIDELRGLVMPELATLLSALRTAKVEYLGWQGATQLSAVDQAESLRRTNPELVIHTWSERSNNMAWLNAGKPPYDDIRVRRAVQMALDVETMSDTLYKGFGDPIPRGRVGLEFKGYYVPLKSGPKRSRDTIPMTWKGPRSFLMRLAIRAAPTAFDSRPTLCGSTGVILI